MASSAVVAVKKALRDGLQNTQDLDGVQIEYGYNAQIQERERIWIGRATFDHDPGPMKTGRTFRNEEGEMDVIVEVEGVGESPEYADERAIALGRYVEQLVADNRNLGNDTANGITVNSVTMQRGEVLNAFNDQGSLTRLVYTLRWTARLT